MKRFEEKLATDIVEEIRGYVADCFECGHFGIETYEDFKREYSEYNKDAWEYYNELVQMGPEGFYEEFKDEYDFDPDFIAEYGLEDNEDSSDFDFEEEE